MTWTNRPTAGDAPGERIGGAMIDAILDEIESRGVLAYGDRQTNSTGTTTIVGVLRLDSVQLRAGRAYEIKTSALRLTSGANDGVTVTIRATTDGTTAGTGSTALTTTSAQVTSASIFETATLQIMYVPTSDVVMSALLCVARTSGTAGNSSLGGNSAYPIQMWIVDVGEAVSDTGTDI